MDDLLTLHADRVQQSNKEHEAALLDILDKADAAMRAKIAEFGNRLVEAAQLADAACRDMSAALNSVIADATGEAAAAFAANLTGIAGSGAAMHAEMRDRATFLATGKLPVREERPELTKPLDEPDATVEGQIEPPVDEAGSCAEAA